MSAVMEAPVPRAYRNWSEQEERIVRQHYPALGSAGCIAHGVNRPASSITKRACVLGVEFGTRGPLAYPDPVDFPPNLIGAGLPVTYGPMVASVGVRA